MINDGPFRDPRGELDAAPIRQEIVSIGQACDVTKPKMNRPTPFSCSLAMVAGDHGHEAARAFSGEVDPVHLKMRQEERRELIPCERKRL